MRKKFIAGNWKMYKTITEALDFAKAAKELIGATSNVQIAIAAPFIALHDLAAAFQGTNVELAAQNCHWEKEGAFTGEISVGMLKELGVQHVLVAHSERRQYFGETNATANKKVKAALAGGLGVILCVGETLAEREGGKTFDVVKDHTLGSLEGITADELKTIVLAYEPVWAIGTGKTATPAQAQEVHAYIRGVIKEKFGAPAADAIRIQYGGSVKPDNVKELMSQPDIDGALVGGASLKADSFKALTEF